jgi:hypothetical protein
MKKLIPLVLVLLSCQKSSTQTDTPPPAGYEKLPQSFPLTNGVIKETSGIADSKSNAGYLWVEQDSGNPPVLYLLKHDGTVSDSVYVKGAGNRDWEDILLSDGNLYVADIGDNNATYEEYIFYRFPEPLAGTDTVTTFDKIRFRYADSAHDAEAFLVDPVSKDIYIITKRDVQSKLYKVAYPQSTTDVNEAVFVMDLSFNNAVSAALSPDAKEIIVKTYTQLYHYTKAAEEPIENALKKAPSTLDYQVEAQGEAISFGLNNSGFFTLSEEALGIAPKLNFYRRK